MKRPLILIAIILLAVAAGAQLTIENHMLDVLPKDGRAAFVERYNKFVASQLKRDWNGTYELLSPAVRQGQNQADFVKVANSGMAAKLKSFEASRMEITFQSGQVLTAFVVGCGVYEGNPKKQASVMPTSRLQGQWYFAPVQTLSAGAHRAPKECQ
jgi:hypothetical protein